MKSKEPRDPRKTSAEDRELESEIRSRRKFSLAEAVGRENADLLKGTSPVTRKRQAEAELEELLARRLDDPEGALRRVLLVWVTESEDLLEAGYEEGARVLVEGVERILASGELTRRFVRAVDAEWGRMYLERPQFDLPGRPPSPTDPYPEEGVRARLRRLLDDLDGGGEDG